MISVTIAYGKIYASKILENCSYDEFKHFSCNLYYYIYLKCPSSTKNKGASEFESV